MNASSRASSHGARGLALQLVEQAASAPAMSSGSSPALIVVAPSVCSAMALKTSQLANVATCAARQLQFAPQPLEHRLVRVADRIVRGDLGVERLAEQDLRVAGIREPQLVGQPHVAAERRVAGDGALLGDQPPEERQQLASPLVRRRPPSSACRPASPRARWSFFSVLFRMSRSRPPKISSWRAPSSVIRIDGVRRRRLLRARRRRGEGERRSDPRMRSCVDGSSR